MTVTRHVKWSKIGGYLTRYSVMEYRLESETLSGQIEQSAISESVCEKLNLVLIPGNPGNELFYERFGHALLEEIWTRAKVLPILYTVSHINHVPDDPNFSKDNKSKDSKDRFNLADQVEHKMEFCREFLHKKARIHLIGHSIGALICLRILNRLKEENYDVSGCYALFPAVERMAETPNGRWIRQIVRLLDNHDFLARTMIFWLDFIPESVKRQLCQWHLGQNSPSCVVAAAVELLSTNVLRNVAHMARNELDVVQGFDESLIPNEYKDRIIFYYGINDGWSPVEWTDGMKRYLQNESAVVIDENGCQHAFVIRDSEIMATQLAKILLAKRANLPSLHVQMNR
ncbi:lipid-droplet associated hydrolase domain-containing protein [Ditylenchus destructor]|uniref:Lipid droplet-associated hydrolase n=1 Tax=Ditylenchus destructor TaxID=166010 RepID=A0AAD4N2T2_9BILA|nr:lipid-droplet associated hydrolase domain-containing protein [Ditylenchus destructor]